MPRKIILIAKFPMTPSVNDLYNNIPEGVSKKKPNGGRTMKPQYRELKESLITGLYNGFFLPEDIAHIYHIDQVYARDIREAYDRAKFQKIDPPDCRFTLEITFVFKRDNGDADNRIKFIQDMVMKWLGADDHRVSSVYVEKIVKPKCEHQYILVVLRQTDKEYHENDILENALQEYSFEVEMENISEEDLRDINGEIDNLDNLDWK